MILKDYPANFFDCVCSDIPYKVKTGGIKKSKESIEKFKKSDPSGIFNRIPEKDLKRRWLKKAYNEDNLQFIADGKLFKHADIKFSEWLPEVYRVLKENSHAYFFVNSRNLMQLQSDAEAAGFKFLNLLIWEKQNKTPNKYYMQQCEFILFLRKGKAKNINNMGMSNVFTIPNIIGKKQHPTEKPVELMRELLKQSTKTKNIILDMFCGSGSTLIAAKELNLEFVGIEIEEKYCKIARNRLIQPAETIETISETQYEQIKLLDL